MDKDKVEKTIEQIATSSKKEYDQFFSRHIKGSKDIVLIVLKCHLFIENILDQILTALIPNPKKLLDKRFSDKVYLIEALNIDDTCIEKLLALNKIRNKLAHNLDYKIVNTDIEPLCKGMDLEASDNIQVQLALGLGHLLGYIMGLKNGITILPFLLTCNSYTNIFEKDFGFDYEAIISTFYSKNDIKNILEKLKL